LTIKNETLFSLMIGTLEFTQIQIDLS